MQLIIISGKGGTGKTTVAASFAYLEDKSIKVDCDVEASNLHLVLKGDDIERHDFFGAKTAKIDPDKCQKCGECERACRFNAITEFQVDELKCEGCGACTVVCPYQAVSLDDDLTGETLISKTGKGYLSRAEMVIGAEGSGKLVTEVRKNAGQYKKNNEPFILDGSPGVGCAVMASVTGCDAALIVVEPTQSGLEDFLRLLSLIRFFGVLPFVCINKYDLNFDVTRQIEQVCREEKVPVMGYIPFDATVQRAINELKPVVCYPKSKAGRQIIMIWNRLNERIKEEIKK